MKKKKSKLNGKQKVAIGMITFSCLLYVSIPFNMCLPLSACMIAGITTMMWGISEILFYAGGALIGKSAIDDLKRKVCLKKRKQKG